MQKQQLIKNKIEFNIGKPFGVPKYNFDTFIKAFIDLENLSADENSKRNGIPFDKETDNWEIQIFEVDSRFLHGFIRLKTEGNIEVITDDGIRTNEVLVEFIYGKEKFTKNTPFRWRTEFFKQLNNKNHNMIDKFIPLVFYKARILEQKLNF